jgi:hypothetical protein
MEAYWIAYKKVTRDFKEFVLTLGIPYNAQVADASDCHGNIVRTSDVVVLGAEHLDGTPAPQTKFYSMYDWNFVYNIGQQASSDLAVSKGIFCFLSKIDAKKFMNR